MVKSLFMVGRCDIGQLKARHPTPICVTVGLAELQVVVYM